MKNCFNWLLWSIAGLAQCSLVIARDGDHSAPVDIGTRVEMFVDDWLIDLDRIHGITQRLHNPVRREVVLTTDKPWEGNASAYFTVYQDGSRYRMYYRGSVPGTDGSENQVTCYAESTDGIRFVRPELGIHHYQGSTNNNIILKGVDCHNFTFLDANPAAKAEQQYKALAGIGGRLFAYASADGIRWTKLRDEPVMTKGTFDSLNLAFWDTNAQCYRAYSRYFEQGGYAGYRAIQNSQSDDFIHWTEPEPNRYDDGVPTEHFYTSATLPCPGATHQYLAFPMRFIPERTRRSQMAEPGVSDAVFMSSRDGKNWDRNFLEAWLRPGQDERNWTQRSNMPAWGIVQTSPDEFSMYVSEHYMWPDNRLRRVTVRRHGFASMHAGVARGEFTTRALTFGGERIVLNYATSAAGALRVEIQDEHGEPLPGYTLNDMDELFGDELDAVVSWKSGSDLSSLAGKPLRFRFELRDADLFALRTASANQ